MKPPTPLDRRVSVMDTTLRDGEQTPLVAYRPAEKLHVVGTQAQHTVGRFSRRRLIFVSAELRVPRPTARE